MIGGWHDVKRAEDSSGPRALQRVSGSPVAGYNSGMAQHGIDKKRCDVALLVDAEAGERKTNGRFVPERSSVEAYVLAALRAQRLNVTVVPFDATVQPTITELRMLKPALVFNLTESVDLDRSQDAAIAGLLDLLNIPYTGTGPVGLRLARDKALSKHIVADLGAASTTSS